MNLMQIVPWLTNAGMPRGRQGPHERACMRNAGHGWSPACSATAQVTPTLQGLMLSASLERSNHS